jgi:hypothetical protein
LPIGKYLGKTILIHHPRAGRVSLTYAFGKIKPGSALPRISSKSQVDRNKPLPINDREQRLLIEHGQTPVV